VRRTPFCVQAAAIACLAAGISHDGRMTDDLVAPPGAG
jgi:hypothetical protein